ncbi:FecR family protein [Chitinophaga sp. RAB17]|uniref:FecR family protein n=1 Tax=Chitinophaga sp. RAB17 TaxID=3233049 RepID=UPI003F8E977D
MEKPVDKILIKKFILNNCTPEEIARISRFLAQPGADRIFEEILNEQWEEGSSDVPVDEMQMKDWEDKFRRRVAQISPPPQKRFKLSTYLKYAAVLAMLITVAGLGRYFIIKGKGDHPAAMAMLNSSTTAGKLLKVRLSDSTIVYLNASSSLQYPETFTGDDRTVTLRGEAFFEVKRDDRHPFFVNTDKLRVQVLGTSFNIRSYHDDEDIAVTVATGKVGVTLPELPNVPARILLPDNELTYTRHSASLKTITVNAADSRAWEKGSFIFDYETLENITRRLSRWYDVKFVCTNHTLLQKRFKLKLKNENLKNVMEALSTAGDGFEYQFKEKQVIIK